MDVRRVAVRGDVAALEWIQNGTNLGMFGPLPPTGKLYSVKTATLLELRHGKIRRAVDYWDRASALKQMGHLREDFMP